MSRSVRRTVISLLAVAAAAVALATPSQAASVSNGSGATCTLNGGSHTARSTRVVNSSCYRVIASINWIDNNGTPRARTGAAATSVATVSSDTAMVTGRRGQGQIQVGNTVTNTYTVAL